MVSGDQSSCWSAGAGAGHQMSPGVAQVLRRSHTASRPDCQGSWPGYSVGRTNDCPPCWSRATSTGCRVFAEGLHRWSSGGHQLRWGRYNSHKPTGSSAWASNQKRNWKENRILQNHSLDFKLIILYIMILTISIIYTVTVWGRLNMSIHVYVWISVPYCVSVWWCCRWAWLTDWMIDCASVSVVPESWLVPALKFAV